jgi:chemotaxis signal transduction protein
MHQPREDAFQERLMTFRVAGAWLAVRLGQMDRVAVAEKLWSVPLAWSNHLGLFDDGQDLIPVVQLAGRPQGAQAPLMVILSIRGQRVGVAIERAGHLYDGYEMLQKTPATLPAALLGLPLGAGRTSDADFWLLDTDLLWQDGPAPVAG